MKCLLFCQELAETGLLYATEQKVIEYHSGNVFPVLKVLNLKAKIWHQQSFQIFVRLPMHTNNSLSVTTKPPRTCFQMYQTRKQRIFSLKMIKNWEDEAAIEDIYQVTEDIQATLQSWPKSRDSTTALLCVLVSCVHCWALASMNQKTRHCPIFWSHKVHPAWRPYHITQNVLIIWSRTIPPTRAHTTTHEIYEESVQTGKKPCVTSAEFTRALLGTLIHIGTDKGGNSSSWGDGRSHYSPFLRISCPNSRPRTGVHDQYTG